MTAEAGGEFDQPAEIGKITDTPALFGMERVERTEESPALFSFDRIVRLGRGAKQITIDFYLADAQIQPMVAKRELRWANQAARDIA